jgi:hypothetical protein
LMSKAEPIAKAMMRMTRTIKRRAIFWFMGC